MKKIEDLNFYELLEISPLASSQEVHKAYERVRRIYEPNSIALYSLFTPEETAQIRQRVEEAYRTLIYDENRRQYDRALKELHEMPDFSPAPIYKPRPVQAPPPPEPAQANDRNDLQADMLPQSAPPPPPQEDVSPVSPFISEFTGPAIKVLREQRNLSIRNIADLTKVGSRYLEYIEAEQFHKLPARPYLRGFLVLYAKALGYDPERVVGDYLRRYDAAMGKPR